MNESQKVFINGVPGRGAEVIKALEDLGGLNSHYWKGDSDNSVYFIDHLGKICRIGHDCELLNVIMDNYREIKLPEKWKYGDVLIKKDGSSFDIFYRYVQDFSFSPLLEVTETVCNEYQRIVTVYTGFYRLATPSEVERFHELLHKHGKDWDAEKKQLVDWKWEPKEREKYFYLSSDLSVEEDSNDGFALDVDRIRCGNCFHTAEEAEAMAEKVRKLLKGETN